MALFFANEKFIQRKDIHQNFSFQRSFKPMKYLSKVVRKSRIPFLYIWTFCLQKEKNYYFGVNFTFKPTVQTGIFIDDNVVASINYQQSVDMIFYIYKLVHVIGFGILYLPVCHNHMVQCSWTWEIIWVKEENKDFKRLKLVDCFNLKMWKIVLNLSSWKKVHKM